MKCRLSQNILGVPAIYYRVSKKYSCLQGTTLWNHGISQRWNLAFFEVVSGCPSNGVLCYYSICRVSTIHGYAQVIICFHLQRVYIFSVSFWYQEYSDLLQLHQKPLSILKLPSYWFPPFCSFPIGLPFPCCLSISSIPFVPFLLVPSPLFPFLWSFNY